MFCNVPNSSPTLVLGLPKYEMKPNLNETVCVGEASILYEDKKTCVCLLYKVYLESCP